MMRLISSSSAVVASDARQYRPKISATVGGEGGGFRGTGHRFVFLGDADRAVSGSPLPRSSRSWQRGGVDTSMCPAMIEGFLLKEGLIGGEGLGVRGSRGC